MLQVDPSAEHEVIEAAYRRLATRTYTDSEIPDQTQERLRLLNSAWAVLGDPVRRLSYDQRRPRTPRPRLRVVLPRRGVLDFGDPDQRRGVDELWLPIGNDGTSPLIGEARGLAPWVTVRTPRFRIEAGQTLVLVL